VRHTGAKTRALSLQNPRTSHQNSKIVVGQDGNVPATDSCSVASYVYRCLATHSISGEKGGLSTKDSPLFGRAIGSVPLSWSVVCDPFGNESSCYPSRPRIPVRVKRIIEQTPRCERSEG
jgi:hypothetical protein